MRFAHLIQRPIVSRRPLPYSSSSSSLSSLPKLFTQKPDPLLRVSSILDSSDPIEPALDRIADSLNRSIVSSVIHMPNPQLGFRFFIWTMKWKHLRSGKLDNLVIDMMIRDPNGGGFQLWWDTLQDLRTSGIHIPSDAFFLLISAYWRAGDAEKAVESFGKMRDYDCKPDVFAYNAILYVMVQKELVLLALALYNQMLKLNCSPNIVTYSILIDGLCKSGMIQDALSLFDEMTGRGISPNKITYTIVLSGLCHAKRDYDAKLLWNEMISSGCPPDPISCNALLAGYCKLGKIDEALDLLSLFQNRGYALGINGYSCLIDALFRVGRFDEANKWFRELCEQGLTPDLVLYTIVIRGYCEAGRVKDASKLVEEMIERGVVPDTQCYNVLIKGFCDVGLLDDAKSLKLEISKNNCFPDTNTYTILICGMCRNGLVHEANKIFEEMEKVGCFPSVVTFNSLIHGLCKAGELEEACVLFSKMEIGRNPSLILRLSQGTDRVMDTASLQNLVSRLCESGLYLKAYRLLMKLAGVLPDIITYNTLINGMCKTKNIDGAFKLVLELQLKGQFPDSITHGTLIDGLCRANRGEEAIGYFDNLLKSGCIPSPDVCKSLMTWLCRKRRVSISFNVWMKYLRSLKNRDEEEIKLIEEHFERGELEEAIQGLLQMDFKLKEFDVGPYTILLIGLCQARRVEDALKVFNILLEFNINVTSPSCVRLIRSLCSLEKLDLAVDVFLYSMESGLLLMPSVCNRLLLALLRSRSHTKHAFSLLSKMESVGYDLDALLHLRTKGLLRCHLNMPQLVTQDTAPQS